jgi:ubiquinone/menaquinone biosynthesis C-methylase UbiE
LTGVESRKPGAARAGGDVLTKLVMRMKAVSPRLERAVMNRWYQYVAGRFQQADWKFMNFGYAELGEQTLELPGHEEADRCCIQLYNHVGVGAGLADKDVLEVGSGRGGGAAWLARNHGPKSMTGLDLSTNAVELCDRLHCGDGLRFRHGSAETMPFADCSFDVVINVESSDGYGRMDRFLGEVIRVLRPGGLMSWVDFRPARHVAGLESLFADCGFRAVSAMDITANVLRSLDLMREQRLALIRSSAPWFVRGLLREFAAVEGSDSYDGLTDGSIVYLSRVLQKPA